METFTAKFDDKYSTTLYQKDGESQTVFCSMDRIEGIFTLDRTEGKY